MSRYRSGSGRVTDSWVRKAVSVGEVDIVSGGRRVEIYSRVVCIGSRRSMSQSPSSSQEIR